MQYSSDPLTVREQSLVIRSLKRYSHCLQNRLDTEQNSELLKEYEQVRTLHARMATIREKQLRENSDLFTEVCNRLNANHDVRTIHEYIKEKTWMNYVGCIDYCDWCREEQKARIKEFNFRVDRICKERGTYRLTVGSRDLLIEKNEGGDVDEMWCGWWQDDHSTTFYSNTPHNVYNAAL